MDRFLIRKRKPEKSDGGESSGNLNSEKQSVSNTAEVPEKVSKNVPENVTEKEKEDKEPEKKSEKVQVKQKQENRKFHIEWENDFFVIEHNNKPFCLLCKLSFSNNKKSNIERHFNSNHSDIESNFLAINERPK